MNSTITYVVLRSRKHPPLGNINVQRHKNFRRELKREKTGWGSAGIRDWLGKGLYTLGNCISQRASRTERFQDLPLFALEGFLANILFRVGSCRQYLLPSTFGRRQQVPFFSIRSYSSSRAPRTNSTETSSISETVEAQASPVGCAVPPLSETPLQDEAIGPQLPRLETPTTTSPPNSKFIELEPRSREEMRTLIMFLKELSDPTEIKTLDSLFYHYRALPAPRLAYLRTEEMNLLLSRFMSVPVRTDLLMIRFLSVVDDMRDLKIPISRNEWITVISYVGQRFNLKVGLPEIEATLKLWRELEKKAGAEFGPTLFNILLDMAAKANQHNLVEAILAEMKYRRIEADRFTLTTVITWYGILRDAASVRETFTRLVQNGEVVDTVVYNALIVAFMRAGEWDTAEELFDRMKSFGKKIKVNKKEALIQGLKRDGSPISPSRDYAAYRRFSQALRMMAKKHQLKSAPECLPFPGDHGSQVYCGPNIVTFNIFLQNHCNYGDFNEVTELLTEMKSLKISLEPSIFLSLFRGFTLHGEGRSSTSKWTRDRIEEVYAALLREVYQPRAQQSEEVRLSTMLACEVVRAFAVTTRSRAKTIKVYRDMEYLYQQGYGHDREIEPVVQRVLQKAIASPLQEAGVMYPISGSSVNRTMLDEDTLNIPKSRESYVGSHLLGRFTRPQTG
ncbi:hypothetical protein EV426DRAFT_580355 [Tirmania nivea]|nr:hypothetical protein EV426DRAFT_580355 [Tirmania nivea]